MQAKRSVQAVLSIKHLRTALDQLLKVVDILRFQVSDSEFKCMLRRWQSVTARCQVMPVYRYIKEHGVPPLTKEWARSHTPSLFAGGPAGLDASAWRLALREPALVADVANKRPDFAGLETGPSTRTFKHLKKNTAKVDDGFRSAVNAALGGVWHEARTHRAFKQKTIVVGDLCVRCIEELSHIVFCCPHWHKERRQVEVPADDADTPACVKLHGLLPAQRVPAVNSHEPALVYRAGVGTVWTDGSGSY
eukprot:1763867-Amphidinium_carterae.1